MVPRIDDVRRRTGLGGLAWLAIVALHSPVQAEVPTFAGVWQTDFGRMILRLEGEAVHGAYLASGRSSAISGSIKDRKFSFEYQEPNSHGQGEFELAEDGGSFAGGFRQAGSETWQAWTGRRVVAESSATSFDGVWQVGWETGPLLGMRLVQSGQQIIGSYDYTGPTSVSGEFKDGRFQFTYREPQVTGEGWFELAPDGQSFHGRWRADGQDEWGTWDGIRVAPAANRTWLVVIEARWEHGLAEQEYTFGEMLRSFFTRTPHVEVRHRFFNDEPDLRKWLGEVQYLAEPTVVLLSTHGTRQGLSVSNQNIGAGPIADTLKYASNVKLLHIDGCSCLAGEVPGQILSRLPNGVRFPISGYAADIDWAGSALVDFLYLDLIFSRGMEPRQAVEQVYRLMPFSGEEQVPGGAIPPTRLRLVMPAESQPAEVPASGAVLDSKNPGAKQSRSP